MNTSNLKNSILLIIAALIWGSGFAIQSIGNRYVGPYTFNVSRFFLGGIALMPLAVYTTRRQHAIMRSIPDSPIHAPDFLKKEKRTLLLGSFFCGLCLFLGGSFQQVGMVYTTAGKAGFITALYIILVPIFGIFLRRKCSPIVWLAVAISLVGLYLLCIQKNTAINIGDIIMLGSAFFYTGHILTVDHFAPRLNAIALSCGHFLVAGAISLIPMLLFESPTLEGLIGAIPSILYLGLFSSGIAYTLQIIGQKDLNPTVACLIMSLESAISAISGWLILGETLSPREITGCVIMFCAILLAQIPMPAFWKGRKAVKG